MLAVAVVLVWLILRGLDLYTRHGQAIVVPNVTGMSVAQAEALMHKNNLEAVVSDSSYVKDKMPGVVLDLNPCVGHKVKKG